MWQMALDPSIAASVLSIIAGATSAVGFRRIKRAEPTNDPKVEALLKSLESDKVRRALDRGEDWSTHASEDLEPTREELTPILSRIEELIRKDPRCAQSEIQQLLAHPFIRSSANAVARLDYLSEIADRASEWKSADADMFASDAARELDGHR
jgi:hypothetical protein